jgi:hypothetical protein
MTHNGGAAATRQAVAQPGPKLAGWFPFGIVDAGSEILEPPAGLFCPAPEACGNCGSSGYGLDDRPDLPVNFDVVNLAIVIHLVEGVSPTPAQHSWADVVPCNFGYRVSKRVSRPKKTANRYFGGVAQLVRAAES